MGDLDNPGHVERLVGVLPGRRDEGEDGQDREREDEVEGCEAPGFIFVPQDCHPNS